MPALGDHRRRVRVLVFSADIGEGHDLPARAIAADLAAEDPPAQVTVLNGLPDMGRPLRALLRGGSWFLLRRLPRAFDLQYLLAARLPPTRWLAQRLLYLLARRGLLRRIVKEDPDVVISTYPGVTAVLGELRRRRRLDVPVYSAITDLAGLHYWAHPGIDMHFVTHPESVEEVERIAGPGSVRWGGPPISPAFLAAADRGEARRALGLPALGKVVVVSGGGWGIGDLARGVEVALDVDGGATVVCLTGRHDDLRRRLEARFGVDPRVRVLGFTERMGELLAAADVLVHSTAGLTVLEAIIRGCPVISYGFAVGHVRANNEAFRRFGLARIARSPAALAGALSETLAQRRAEPDLRFALRRPIASFLLDAEPRVIPLPAWRLRAGRAAAATAASFLVTGAMLSTDGAYTVLARVLDLRPLSTVSTSHREVGLLVDAPARLVPTLTRQLEGAHGHASFAVEGAVPNSTRADASRAGDETIPRLRGARALSWLTTRQHLRRSARRLGLSGHFLYAVPHDGFTMGQYLLAYAAGARPVSGAIRYGAGGSLTGLRAGDVVEVSLRPGDTSWTQALASVVARCRRAGLQPVAVSALMAGGSSHARGAESS